MSTSTVELVNIGPISKLSIPVPENGGLVVMRARNGAGKTTALNAVQSLLTGNGKASVRDGTLKGGINGFGASMTVARNTRRSGELEVTSLEGRLNAADLVDPGLQDPAAADAKRIRALVQLSGVEPEPSLFYDLLGGRSNFEAICTGSTKDDDDILKLAGRVKRECEAAARLRESQASSAAGSAKAKRESAQGVNLSGECDSSVLQASLEKAIRNQSTLVEGHRAAQKARENADKARCELEERRATLESLSLDEANDNLRAAAKAVDVADEEFHAAERRRNEARNQHAMAMDAVKSAKQMAEAIAGWESAIEIGNKVTVCTEEELSAAEQAVIAAREAVEQGALIRKAKDSLADAENYEIVQADHARKAELLRDAARGTDEILSELVGKLGTPLRVEAGRLVLTTKRGDTYFGDLSHGERWKIAIDLCVDIVGAAGVLTIPQEAYEGLDPLNREAIAEHAKRRGVLILTAEASADEEIVAGEFVSAN